MDVSPWILYSLVRLGIFGGVFLLLYLSGITWWVGLIFATIISFTASYVFMAKTRQAMADTLRHRRENRSEPRDPDAEAEDQERP